MASSGDLDFPYSPPPPSPSNNTTIVVIVFFSFCGVLFFSFLAAAICCFLKKMKKKKMIQETDVVHVDEHLKMKEAVVEGPHDPQAVVLEFEDDVHADEIVRKNEKIGTGANPKTEAIKGSAVSQEAGVLASSSGAAKSTTTAAVCCFIKGKKKTVEETDVVHVDEHLKMKEAIAGGGHHHGPEAVVLQIEDDVHVDKIVRKNEKVGEGLEAAAEKRNNSIANSSGSNDHPSLQHKA